MCRLVGPLQLVQAHPEALKGARARALSLALPIVLLAGCVTTPPPPAEDAPPREPYTRPAEPPVEPKPSPYGYREEAGYARSAEEVSGPAVINLLGQARSELAAGRTDQAVAALETALQIEKRNPFVWQQLAAAHLQRCAPEDAEIVAQRSNSFARGNPYIEVENWRLIAAARSARGDAAGAEQARDKVAELQDRIEE